MIHAGLPFSSEKAPSSLVIASQIKQSFAMTSEEGRSSTYPLNQM
ncbi:hypothetical protein [Peribacillus sp. SCS-37]